ncbi:hypothetical protein MRX96_009604 [Rhipicephalus microplus]
MSSKSEAVEECANPEERDERTKQTLKHGGVRPWEQQLLHDGGCEPRTAVKCDEVAAILVVSSAPQEDVLQWPRASASRTKARPIQVGQHTEAEFLRLLLKRNQICVTKSFFVKCSISVTRIGSVNLSGF